MTERNPPPPVFSRKIFIIFVTRYNKARPAVKPDVLLRCFVDRCPALDFLEKLIKLLKNRDRTACQATACRNWFACSGSVFAGRAETARVRCRVNCLSWYLECVCWLVAGKRVKVNRLQAYACRQFFLQEMYTMDVLAREFTNSSYFYRKYMV